MNINMNMFNYTEIKQIIFDIFRDMTQCRMESENEIILNFPFYDKNFEPLYLKLKYINDRVLITDDGETFGKLYLAGQNPYDHSNQIFRRISEIFDTFQFNKSFTEIHDINVDFAVKNKQLELNPDRFIDYINLLININSLINLPPKYAKQSFRTLIDNILVENKVKTIKKDVVVDEKKLQLKIDYYIETVSSNTYYIQAISQENKYYKSYYNWDKLQTKFKKINLFDSETTYDTLPPNFKNTILEKSNYAFFIPKEKAQLVKY